MDIPEKYRLKSEQKLLCQILEGSKELEILRQEINKMIPEQEKNNILLAEENNLQTISLYLLFLSSIEANEIYKEINSFVLGFMVHWDFVNKKQSFKWTEEDRKDYLTFMETH